jgi:hypothetical protein
VAQSRSRAQPNTMGVCVVHQNLRAGCAGSLRAYCRCRVRCVLTVFRISRTPVQPTGQNLGSPPPFPRLCKTRRSRYSRPDPRDGSRNGALAPHSRPRDTYVEPSRPSKDGCAGFGSQARQLRGLRCRRVGAVHSIKSDGLAVGRSLPVCPRQRTSPRPSGMSQACHKQTFELS